MPFLFLISVTLDCLIGELLGRSQVEVVLCLFVC